MSLFSKLKEEQLKNTIKKLKDKLKNLKNILNKIKELKLSRKQVINKTKSESEREWNLLDDENLTTLELRCRFSKKLHECEKEREQKKK